jgi:hypothetical protein
VTVYDYRHGEDRVRFQINDTGVLFMFFPYDTRDPQIQKYPTSIGINGVYYTRRISSILVPSFIGELSLCLWLIVIGVYVQKWEERANRLANYGSVTAS